MDLLDAALILAAGTAAGTINAAVGSGSLITFPTLLALGIPPVTANVSNNIGLVPGGLASVWGYRRELADQRRRLVVLGSMSVLGGVIGSVLLLVLPESAFGEVVPVLIGVAIVLVALQPWMQRTLARRRAGRSSGRGAEPTAADVSAPTTDIASPAADVALGAEHIPLESVGATSTAEDIPHGSTGIDPSATDARPGTTDARPGTTDAGPGATDARPGTTDASPGTTDARPGATGIGPGAMVATALVGIYGGYFGGAQGILLVGALGALMTESLQRLNALKNGLVTAVNFVAAVTFLVVAPERVDWRVVGLIAVGSTAGGLIGSKIGRKLPQSALRGVIIVVGLIAIANLLRQA